MGELFKSWRRRIGVVMLLVTLCFALGWVRSVGLTDFVGITFAEFEFYVVSFDGLLTFERTHPLSAGMSTSNHVAGEPDRQITTRVTNSTRQPAGTMMPFWGCTRLSYYHDGIGVRTGSRDVN